MSTVTAEQLERIAKKRRFSTQTLDIAKRLFLYRDAAKALSVQYGVNIPRIYAIRDTVAKAVKEERVPPGWEEVTLVAPKALIAEFRGRVEEARAQLTGEAAAAVKRRDEANAVTDVTDSRWAAKP
jgi:hypothetical protein